MEDQTGLGEGDTTGQETQVDNGMNQSTIIPGMACLDWVAILPVWKLTLSIYSALQE